ncbi:hypothetical protein [Commensalibacter oyaizuii]|uniref:GtrA-like protein domain-containing protein n=1 Tax=Commensalibacter oyaizuii TaxID=3043873 RepID=A0ABT6PZA1_9PROT|nr:hypothetical protein [Commensalibacter sp. TBRC 16381]MDI2090055.1 hypothetical protein [Commensalibacter sp. TBRC 16381]
MIIFVTIVNLIGLFLLIASLKHVRARHKIPPASFKEKVLYQIGFIALNMFSLLLCLYYWSNPGWLIWINLTSLNALIAALIIGFYPKLYAKYITRTNQ